MIYFVSDKNEGSRNRPSIENLMKNQINPAIPSTTQFLKTKMT
jgi:hypothetical protein